MTTANAHAIRNAERRCVLATLGVSADSPAHVKEIAEEVFRLIRGNLDENFSFKSAHDATQNAARMHGFPPISAEEAFATYKEVRELMGNNSDASAPLFEKKPDADTHGHMPGPESS